MDIWILGVTIGVLLGTLLILMIETIRTSIQKRKLLKRFDEAVINIKISGS